MTIEPTGRHRAHEALAVPSRVRLLDLLRASARPLEARELAEASGLHVSTVRFHLGVLGDAGLTRSRSGPARGRGRPPLRYVASPGQADDEQSGSGADGYALLAAVLAEHWAGSAADRARLAEHAGRAMARRRNLAALRPPDPTAEESLAMVGALFAELGFEPEIAVDEQHVRMRLHACPFRAVAAEHPEVVCSLHLGLLRGTLADLGAPLTATGLRPFVEPHLCIADLAAAADEPG